MSAVDRVLATALAEEGYLEKASNSQLDSQTANAGSANYTKYARDLDAVGMYNGKKQGYAWCFTEGTLVLTDKGYAKIEEIKTGDRVLSAHGNRFNTVTEVASHEDDVVDVTAFGTIPFSVTPDHPFLSQRRNDPTNRSKGFNSWGFNEIGTLKKGDMLSIPKSPALFKNVLSYDELWLLGYYVGDGCLGKSAYILCANERKAVEIEKHTDAHRDANYASRTCYQYNLMWRNCSDDFKEAMDDCGRGACHKRVPRCILYGENESKKAFLDGYFAADGCEQLHSFSTVSEKLATGIIKLIYDLGGGCGLHLVKKPPEGQIWDRRYNTYRTFHQKEISYACTVSVTAHPKHQDFIQAEKYAFVPIKQISDEVRTDTVYTLYVDGDNTYTANNLGVHNCDMFVDWCFYKTFGLETMLAMTGQVLGGLGAGCTYSARYYKNMGRFYTSDPQPGDQIFFSKDSGATMYHTGLVTKVTSSKVYTIEGNTSSASGVVENGGAVAQKSYSLTYSRIAGYGRPNWDLVTDTDDIAYTSVSYTGTVTASVLNCRSYPSTTGTVVTTYAKGTTLTITREYNGWGYTGTGWVSLTYVTKVADTASTTTTTIINIEEDEDMTLDSFKSLWKEMRSELQDNDASTWSAEGRQWCVDNGIVAGGSTSEFNGMWEDVLTREQMAVMLYRFAKLVGIA